MAKKPASKTKKKSAATKAKKSHNRVKRQKGAVVLFAVGILLGLLALIKGDGMWRSFRDLFFGLLGWSTYFMAPICIYLSVIATQDKPDEFIANKLIQSSVLLVLISGAIEVFGGLPEVEGFSRVIRALFDEGVEGKGGGVLGIITALPLTKIGSSPIPQIIIILCTFVFVMLITGSSLLTLYHGIKKPVESIEGAYNQHREQRRQERELLENGDEPEESETFYWEEEPAPSPEYTKEFSPETEGGRFDIDVDISKDKTPEELDKVEPIKTLLDDFNDKELTSRATEKQEHKRENILKDWGVDNPVEYISTAEGLGYIDSPTIEIEAKPHPLEADINEAKENDVLRVVQEYLSSVKGGAAAANPYKQEEQTPVEVETFIADLSDVRQAEFTLRDEPRSPFAPPQEQSDQWQKLVIDINSAERSALQQGEEDSDKPEIEAVNLEAVVPQPPSRISAVTAEAKKIKQEDKAVVEYQDDSYRLPPISLLEKADRERRDNIEDELKENAKKLVETLENFGVKTSVVGVSRGPSVTRYELQPAPGVKISRITGLADDIALNLAAAGIRIEAPIPNMPAVGVEIPNKNVTIVKLRDIVDSRSFRDSDAQVAMALGKDITGEIKVADISKMPHMLIAGATGSGKSVCINSIIMSILYKYSPDEVKLVMIDPKVVELGVYNGIPHLLVPVVTDPKKASGALSWAVQEMLKRYRIFADNSVRDLSGYNALVSGNDELEYMPKVVIIIDELADLMMATPTEVEDSICRLAQMARAAGMHLVIATQRPSVDVITGVIKANIPSRIAFAVSSQVDSRTILDMGGAEKLLGRGDMLFYPVGAPKPIRVQGCFVTDKEVERVVKQVKASFGSEYDETVADEIDRLSAPDKETGGSTRDGLDDEDEMVPYAIECVVEAGQASTSMLQRRLKLGYARAARIIDQLEARGIIGGFEGSKPRELFITKDQYIEMKLAGLDQPNAGQRPTNQEDVEIDD